MDVKDTKSMSANGGDCCREDWINDDVVVSWFAAMLHTLKRACTAKENLEAYGITAMAETLLGEDRGELLFIIPIRAEVVCVQKSWICCTWWCQMMRRKNLSL